MRKFLSFIMVFFITGAMFAAPVTQKQAKQVALNYYTYRADGVKAEIAITKSKVRKYQGMNTLYMFSFKDGGFVIVAADDAVTPILGYSVDSELGKRMSPEFESWLDAYSKQIKNIVDSKLDNTQTVAEWNKILTKKFDKKSTKGVGELLTTKWDQGYGYNTFCPEESLTGCVATAMAQIMKYHSYPESGASQHSYRHEDYGILSANFKSVTYDWDAMPNSMGNEAVATLMYHCGVAVDMQYAPSPIGSGALSLDVPYALANYFKYDQSIDFVLAQEYSADEWKTLLKGQLDASHPVLYSGSSAQSGGHAFVCDGYDDDDKFHFNWGWSGSGNAFFAIGTLNPLGENFSEKNSAVINIFPASAGAPYPFRAVKKFSALSDVASESSPYIRYMHATNDAVAWGIAADGSGAQAEYKLFTTTSDGGLTWKAGEVEEATGDGLGMVFGMDENTAFIPVFGGTADKNQILKTTDAGETWTSVLTGGHAASFFNVVHFFNENDGFVQGDPDTEFELYTTSDGGENWTRVDGANIPDPISGEFGIVGLYTAAGDKIWFTTNKGRVYKSEDKGLNWTVSQIIEIATGHSSNIEIAFSDDGNTGLAVALDIEGDNSVTKHCKTTDGGATWNEITPSTGNFYDNGISSIPGSPMPVFISVGGYATDTLQKMGLSVTMDGGENWVELGEYYKNYQFISVAASSQNKAYIGSFAAENTGGAWMFGATEPLKAIFSVDDSLQCANTDITYTSTSSGDIETYEWNFGEGANPETASGIGPHTVQYSTGGYKTVTLVVGNSETSNTLTKENVILVATEAPNAIDQIEGPTTTVVNKVYNYSVPNQDYTFFDWEITGGAGSVVVDYLNEAQIKMGPYPGSNTFSVTPFNGCGEGTAASIAVTSGDDDAIAEINKGISISPNPATDYLNIVTDELIENIKIINADGKVVCELTENTNDVTVDISQYPAGMYILNVKTANNVITEKFVIK